MASRNHSRMNSVVAAAAETCEAILREEVARVFAKHRKLRQFGALMGAVSFYDAEDMPIDYTKLPKAAQQLEDMAGEYTDTFGSPGVFLYNPN